jgi:hypothetical protein
MKLIDERSDLHKLNKFFADQELFFAAQNIK